MIDRNKDIDAGEFGDVVASSNEKFVVAGDAAAKISKLVELGQRGSNGSFDRSDFMVGNS